MRIARAKLQLERKPTSGAGGQAFAGRSTEPSKGKNERVDHPSRHAPSAVGHPEERRSTEALANANALKLGLAAQLFTSAEKEAVSVLPLAMAPTARAAAKYQTTAIGVDKTFRLGLENTA